MTDGSSDDHASSCYLSVVVTTRNDDHGGDPLKRLQVFVNCFDEQCRRTGLDAEVIVVEWNPPPDRPRIASLLALPHEPSCVYRFVEVPPEIHATLRGGDVLPLFQMIAKNVGVRRARGRFVLATNIDIIFSMDLIDLIASRRLEPNCLYRVDRHNGNAEELPAVVPPQPFDLVYSFGVIHHSPHPRRIVEHLRRYMTPDSELRLMVYSRVSYKLFWIMKQEGLWDMSRIDELVARNSEAQTGCPVTYTYTDDPSGSCSRDSTSAMSAKRTSSPGTSTPISVTNIARRLSGRASTMLSSLRSSGSSAGIFW